MRQDLQSTSLISAEQELNYNFRASTPARRAAQAQLVAYNNHDIEAFAAVYSDDIQFIDLKTGKILCSGKSELLKIYGKIFSENPNLHCELINRTSFGDMVYDQERVTGHPKGGGCVVNAMAAYLVNEEGLITKAWFASEEVVNSYRIEGNEKFRL